MCVINYLTLQCASFAAMEKMLVKALPRNIKITHRIMHIMRWELRLILSALTAGAYGLFFSELLGMSLTLIMFLLPFSNGNNACFRVHDTDVGDCTW